MVSFNRINYTAHSVAATATHMKADIGEGKEGIVEVVQEKKRVDPEIEENVAAVALQSTIYTALKEQLEALQKVFTPYTYFLYIPVVFIYFSYIHCFAYTYSSP
jgi:hypothetical protein